MSRIGKLPVSLPKGVSVTVSGDVVTVKGPKGELSQKMEQDITVEIKDGTVEVSRPTEQKRHKALHGLYRSLINNMVVGVSEGYTKKLELVGVGYKATNKGNVLELNLGYSHNIYFMVPEEVTVTTETAKGKNPIVTLQCTDKQLIGHVAAEIRSLRKVEPYKGKGVRFVGEIVRRKAGKAGAKK
jgi:large subunit ribosomal protein L6